MLLFLLKRRLRHDKIQLSIMAVVIPVDAWLFLAVASVPPQRPAFLAWRNGRLIDPRASRRMAIRPAEGKRGFS
jgi:hypothetical protein